MSEIQGAGLDITGTAAGRQTTECLTKLRQKNSDRKTFCILGRNFVTCKQVYRLLHGTHKEQCNLQKFEEQAIVSPWRLVTIVHRDQKNLAGMGQICSNQHARNHQQPSLLR